MRDFNGHEHREHQAQEHSQQLAEFDLVRQSREEDPQGACLFIMREITIQVKLTMRSHRMRIRSLL